MQILQEREFLSDGEVLVIDVETGFPPLFADKARTVEAECQRIEQIADQLDVERPQRAHRLVAHRRVARIKAKHDPGIHV